MDVLFERCCGLDVHKRLVVACVILTPHADDPERIVHSFGTMTAYWQPIVRHEALFDREGMKGPLLRTVGAVC
jgi:hypothetical protein